MDSFPFQVSKGQPFPYGAIYRDGSVNFAVVSSRAKQLSLCLFDPIHILQPKYEVVFDPQKHKTGNVWHICIEGLPAHFLYLYRINQHLLLDPYTKGVYTPHSWGESGSSSYSPFCVILPVSSFDWEGDQSPNIAINDLMIYEMHVRGFTQHGSSGVQYPGTFLGVIEKIPYLLDLGINAVELMPIHEFNECEVRMLNPATKEKLYNYWGYSTVNFFSPMQRFATDKYPEKAIFEFKTLVKELHRHGIEVILDVVYNHTAEGGTGGPVLSFKGFDNSVYYMRDNHGKYLNFSGCGNTVNCNHPIVSKLILDSLRYWVSEMHVDGFRFDLASIFRRGLQGQPLEASHLVEQLSNDPVLANTKLIAEPWDAGGLYQVGSFIPSNQENHWSEWNGRYRDDIRRFIKGSGLKGPFVTNICGSQDLYYNFKPSSSINFITSHDGFTLADLVAYNQKHNQNNGEDNRDGLSDNESWNCGYEGPTEDSTILSLRSRQMRNFHLAMMVSKGVPMLLMGDEYGHTKRGNNNTWCQDNELNWFLWDHLEGNEGFYQFYRKLIRFRQKNAWLRKNAFLKNEEIECHGREAGKPNWHIEDQFIAFTLKDSDGGHDLYLAFNASSHSVDIHFPPTRLGQTWRWVVNTANESPHDFIGDSLPAITSLEHTMIPFSALMLELH